MKCFGLSLPLICKHLVKQRGKVVADAVAVDVAHNEIVNDINTKADDHIMHVTTNKPDRSFLPRGAVGAIEKITAHHKEHRDRQAIERMMRVSLPDKMNAYDQKGQKDLKKIQPYVSMRVFFVHSDTPVQKSATV